MWFDWLPIAGVFLKDRFEKIRPQSKIFEMVHVDRSFFVSYLMEIV